MQNLQFQRGVIKPVECVKEGYELIKSEYWLLFAIWLVGGMIGGVSFFIAAGAMTCGTSNSLLHQPNRIRGEAEAVRLGSARPAPHVVAAITQVGRQDGGKLAHIELKRFRHQV